MYYVESPSHDPRFNLALEQYLFDRPDRAHSYCMLWQNEKAVIVGKHQNTAGEIHGAYVREHGIEVVRRLSGGGAVYHDLGNINYTFIADAGAGSPDFTVFCRPVIRALGRFGVRAELSGRNDLTIQGKKFSGNAQYSREGRVMHHGTILYDSDLEAIGRALAVPRDKLESNGVPSTRSRVTNVRPFVAGAPSTREFFSALRGDLMKAYDLKPYPLTDKDLIEVKRLQQERYDRWEWNYGASPPYRLRKARRIDGCGRLEVFLDVRQGRVRDAAFYGDYFGDGDPADLARLLIGHRLEGAELRSALAGVDLGVWFRHMDLDHFLDILLLED